MMRRMMIAAVLAFSPAGAWAADKTTAPPEEKPATQPASGPARMEAPSVRAVRFATNPILRQDMPHVVGKNTNGPCLIRVPDWLDKPLGTYYLYFADHHGKQISLAWANDLAGPWTVVAGGVLTLEQTACKKHIASPDVHVDDQKKEIRMYFHGPARDTGQQVTYLARSKDARTFTAGTQALGPSYFCVFEHGGYHYTVTKIGGQGLLWRSRDAAAPFEKGPELIPSMRHSGALVRGDTLWLFYTKIGDAPERIFAVRIDLRQDWTRWAATMSEPVLVLKPEKDYEGARLPVGPSASGPAKGRMNQLRDPALFEDGGKTYLIYSIAGENGLAMAELILGPPR